MKEYDSLSDNEKRNMLASVANLYYNVEMTQNQIAERFFTSRSKISRMLKEARQLGIVEIKILEPWDRNVELEQEFMRRFALKDVRVISVKEANNTMVLQKLGEDLNSIMILLIPVPKPTAYLLHETPLFCRPLQNISFLSHSSSYVLATPPILAIFYFCRFPAFFTLSQVDRNHYIFIISSFLLA